MYYFLSPKVTAVISAPILRMWEGIPPIPWAGQGSASLGDDAVTALQPREPSLEGPGGCSALPSLPCVPAITLAQFNTAPPWPPLATQPIGWPPRKLHGWTSSSSFCLHPEHVSDLFRTPLMARAACGSLFVCRVSGLTPTAEGLLPQQCSHGTSKAFAFFYPCGSRILFSILCYQFEVFYLSLISS